MVSAARLKLEFPTSEAAVRPHRHRGTAAMLWVGGHIPIVGAEELGWHAPYDFVHDLGKRVEDVDGIGGVLAWELPARTPTDETDTPTPQPELTVDQAPHFDAAGVGVLVNEE